MFGLPNLPYPGEKEMYTGKSTDVIFKKINYKVL